MDDMAKRFVHVLLFSCPNCERPIAATQMAVERNLEEVDESSFAWKGLCGGGGNIEGLKAHKHWVEPWQ
jgi:hypothetical protein